MINSKPKDTCEHTIWAHNLAKQFEWGSLHEDFTVATYFRTNGSLGREFCDVAIFKLGPILDPDIPELSSFNEIMSLKFTKSRHEFHT